MNLLNILSMIKLMRLLLLPGVLMIFLFSGCEEDEILSTKYDRPDWLSGKVFTQIKDQPELSVFASAVELAGYDSIIDVSGSYTVFAPSDEAFNAWMSENNFSDVQDIPLERLSRLVSYHIVQNLWTKRQLRTLDVFGWIDTLDIYNDKPRGFKRQTLLRDENRKYGVASKGPRTEEDDNLIIVDTIGAPFQRRVLTDSRKYAPIFFQEYFDIYDLDFTDYEFYFDRPFNGGSDIHFADARIEGDEIFAENGVLYIVDRVVEPLPNSYQLLSENQSSFSYSSFLDLINQFPDFNYDQQETFDQPGADQGLQVDSLFNLRFPELAFDIASERTSAPNDVFGLPSDVTIRYHHGIVAPENNAFNDFLNEYINVSGGWGSLDQTPDHIKKIIANTYLSVNPIYPSDLQNGFLNGERDMVKIDNSDIIQKQFGSNSTLLGLNKAIVPRAFSSVAGPVYLRPGYQKVMFAIEHAGLLSALKRTNQDYMFFVESDFNTSIDSSLVYDPFREEFSTIQILGPGSITTYKLADSDLRTMLLNHIAVGQLQGVARKEFIPNLAGNYIIINNETGEFSGTAPTTFGFRGAETRPNFPTAITVNDENETTYEIDNWFSFSGSSLYSQISSQYPRFHALLVQAGLVLPQQFRYTFIADTESYTVLLPSDSALDAASDYLNGLSADELRDVLLLHFVRGDIIFTDGKKQQRYYETARVDESSTPFSTVYTQIFIQPDIDVIRIKDNNSNNFTEINESDLTNKLAGVTTTGTNDVFPIIKTNAVIHEIDKVLIKEELDTN